MLKDGKTEITCWSTRPEWQQVRQYNFPARRKQPPRLEENLQTHTQTWWGFHWPHCKGARFGAGRSLLLQFNPARPNGHLKGTRRLKGHSVGVRRRIHQVELRQQHATVKRSILTAHTRNQLPSVHLDTLWRETKEFRLNSHCVFHQWRKTVGLERLTRCHILWQM